MERAAEAEAARNREVCGVVLAGGKSSRMGRDKASLLLAGEPLLRRVVERLRQATGDVLVVGPVELEELVPGLRVVPDAQAGGGPLGGLVTALQSASTSRVFVVGCDMPFVRPALVAAIIERAQTEPALDAVVLRTDRGIEPLHAVYARSCLHIAAEQLQRGDRSLLRLVQRLRVGEMGPAEAAPYDPLGLSSYNVNSPEDWAHALTLVDA